MIDLNNHWEGVDHGNRHIIKGMSKDFKDRHLNNFKKYYLEYIDTSKVTSSLDSYNPFLVINLLNLVPCSLDLGDK